MSIFVTLVNDDAFSQDLEVEDKNTNGRIVTRGTLAPKQRKSIGIQTSKNGTGHIFVKSDKFTSKEFINLHDGQILSYTTF